MAGKARSPRAVSSNRKVFWKSVLQSSPHLRIRHMHNSDYIPLYPSWKDSVEMQNALPLLHSELNKPPSSDITTTDCLDFKLGRLFCRTCILIWPQYFSQKHMPSYIDLAGWWWRGVPHPQHYGRCPPLSSAVTAGLRPPWPALPSWPAAVSWTLVPQLRAPTIISSLVTHSGQKVFYRRPHSSFCVKFSQKWRLHHLSIHQDPAQC